VQSDVAEVGQAADLAATAELACGVSAGIRAKKPDEIAVNTAASMSSALADIAGKITLFGTAHPLSSRLLGSAAGALSGEAAQLQGWIAGQQAFLALHPLPENRPEEMKRLSDQAFKEAAEHPGFGASQLADITYSYESANMMTGGALDADVQIRKAFRNGDVSLKGLEEGEAAVKERGIIVGSVNAVVMLGTLGLGFVFQPVTIGGAILFGGLTSAGGTAIVLGTQSIVTSQITLSDPVAQSIWRQGGMSIGDIALTSLGQGLIGAAMGGLGAWAARGPNAALARQLVAESLEFPTLQRELAPGITARGAGPGVVEVTQAGQPGVVRFTVSGWETTVPGAPGAQSASGTWSAPIGGAHPATGPLQGYGAFQFQQPGALPFGVAVGEQGWIVLGPRGVPVRTGGWSIPAAGAGGLTMLPAGPAVLPEYYGVPLLPPGTPVLPAEAGLPGAGVPDAQTFVDIQGGAAVRADTGAPTFLPSLVAQTPGASGILLEGGDFIPGYAGITTTNARDLAMARVLAQNLPQWPNAPPAAAAGMIPLTPQDAAMAAMLQQAMPRWPIAPGAVGLPDQPAPWLWEPQIAFPTVGPVQVLTTPGPAGTTPVPQAFFPPIGGDVVPGVPRLIPVRIGEASAQQDVRGLQISTHPELHGQIDRAYWRRPFALGAADARTVGAIGTEVGQWLKPGGFLELRLLRANDLVAAHAIASHMPDARVVVVGSGAIRAFRATGQRPPGLTNEQWAVLSEAGPDIRGEFGALGQGAYRGIARIYRGGGPAPQRVLVVGAEQPVEFGWAAGLQATGQDVTVVNPRTTEAARQFRQGGGNLVTGTVESLPANAAFNVIREDFPFPLGRVFQPTREFAMARISRLLPGGRWVVVTESREFATTLEAAVAGLDVDTIRTAPPLAHEATPSSPWLPEESRERFMLVFTRRRQP
jgi:hypothetical protein